VLLLDWPHTGKCRRGKQQRKQREIFHSFIIVCFAVFVQVKKLCRGWRRGLISPIPAFAGMTNFAAALSLCRKIKSLRDFLS